MLVTCFACITLSLKVKVKWIIIAHEKSKDGFNSSYRPFPHIKVILSLLYWYDMSWCLSYKGIINFDYDYFKHLVFPLVILNILLKWLHWLLKQYQSVFTHCQRRLVVCLHACVLHMTLRIHQVTFLGQYVY